LVFTTDQRGFTLGLNLMRLMGQFTSVNQAAGVAFLSWTGMAVALAALLPFQLLSLDDLALRTGKEAEAGE